MTKEETIKILAMLSAFYGQGKSNPEQMATAWHLILSKYDYRITQKAILSFAENDVREYATFPDVGKIVEAIRNEMAQEAKPIKDTIMCIQYGKPYISTPPRVKALISEERYNEWLAMDAEIFNNCSDVLAESLK